MHSPCRLNTSTLLQSVSSRTPPPHAYPFPSTSSMSRKRFRGVLCVFRCLIARKLERWRKHNKRRRGEERQATRMYADNLSLFFILLSLRLCLCLRLAGLHVRGNDASTSTREWKSFHSLVLVLMLASLCRTCEPARRKCKYKRKHKALMFASHVGFLCLCLRRTRLYDCCIFQFVTS